MHKAQGIKRITRAGTYAANGIRAAFRHEAAFRQEACLAFVLLPIPFFLSLTASERVILIAVTVLVMIVELLNSAIETVVDRVGMEIHELSGRAKDMGSGAVMLSLLLWVYTWAEILLSGD